LANKRPLIEEFIIQEIKLLKGWEKKYSLGRLLNENMLGLIYCRCISE
jgi:hypothetical protein